jgi:hypothetical protein
MQPGSAELVAGIESNSLRRESSWPGLTSKRTKTWKDKARRPLHLLLYVVPSAFALTMARAAR